MPLSRALPIGEDDYGSFIDLLPWFWWSWGHTRQMNTREGGHDGVPACEPVGDHQEEVVAVEWEEVSHQHLEGVVWATNGQ